MTPRGHARRRKALVVGGATALVLSGCAAGALGGASSRRVVQGRPSLDGGGPAIKPSTIVLWGDARVTNPFDHPARIVSAKVLTNSHLRVKGFRVRRSYPRFFMAPERAINHGDPEWRWKRLRAMPVTVAANSVSTVVLRLALAKGAKLGYLVGVDVTVADFGDHRVIVRLPKAAVLCITKEDICPKAAEDRAYAAAAALTE